MIRGNISGSDTSYDIVLRRVRTVVVKTIEHCMVDYEQEEVICAHLMLLSGH